MGGVISGKQLNTSAMTYQAECLELSSGETNSEGWEGLTYSYLVTI